MNAEASSRRDVGTAMPGAPAPAGSAPRDRTLVMVATAYLIQNWSERRIYEPLADQFRVHAIQWDRAQLTSERGRERADRFRVTSHDFPNEPWGIRSLLRFHQFIERELDRIQAQDGLDVVVAADPDVLPAIVWHRLTRGLRYTIIRNEVDYYAGSRGPGTRLANRARRLALDVLEAILHAQCDYVITLNRHAARRLRMWGFPERKIVVGGLWKEDAYFAGDREAYKDVLLERGLLTPEQVERVRGRYVITFFGLFYAHTHIQELLDVARNYPDQFAVLLAGMGADLPVVHRYAAENPNLIFLGWRHEDDLKELNKIADIIYQPLDPRENVNWKYFGSTNKTFEALAAGCLFIGSSINERSDLNAEAEFQVPIDFDRDVRAQIDELFRAILADPEQALRRRQRNARKLFERCNHGTFVKVVRPIFERR